MLLLKNSQMLLRKNPVADAMGFSNQQSTEQALLFFIFTALS